ncbi:MAG: cobalt transport protein, partial [Clostridia bacterium]|nr:cobalt transport protein [Clostridia bacterium]
MFCNNPIIALMSMMGALVTYFSLGGKCRFKDHFFFVLLFVVGTVINPVFNHNGQTVLFFVNDNPITLEALVWGAVSSGTIVSVIYWFRAFSLVMTGDRLLYVFGAFSPKMALMLSMALRYIPLFGIQAEKVDAAQRAVGAGGKDDIWGRIKAKLRVFWVMVTWTLENG